MNCNFLCQTNTITQKRTLIMQNGTYTYRSLLLANYSHIYSFKNSYSWILKHNQIKLQVEKKLNTRPWSRFLILIILLFKAMKNLFFIHCLPLQPSVCISYFCVFFMLLLYLVHILSAIVKQMIDCCKILWYCNMCLHYAGKTLSLM